MYGKCKVCPRECGVDRENGERGFCGMDATVRVSRVSLHMWEEPPISGTRGSGTVFFSGCSLRCVFCQNKEISGRECGREISVSELANAMLSLRDAGAHNINLVTPTHFLPSVTAALETVKPILGIPVVYNCGGYERAESLKMLDGLVDIYLPDCKYLSPEISAKYSAATDYFEVAQAALEEMYRQVSEVRFTDGTEIRTEERAGDLMVGGMIVRHLVLPGCRKDSIALLHKLAEILPASKIRLSLMRQFTPEFVEREAFPELCRRLTSFEYESVLKTADRLGFVGYSQAAESASSEFTPDFNTDGAFALIKDIIS